MAQALFCFPFHWEWYDVVLCDQCCMLGGHLGHAMGGLLGLPAFTGGKLGLRVHNKPLHLASLTGQSELREQDR